MQNPERDTWRLKGVIASAGFASGDRLVVGAWRSGPLGPMNDVMWVDPAGRRILLAPTDAIGRFVSAIYAFEEIRIEPVTVQMKHGVFELVTPSVNMRLVMGRKIPIPLGFLRRPAFVRRVEAPIASALLKVNTYGLAPSGVEEWYCADSLRRVRSGTASAFGADLGVMGPLTPPLRVGFSEPPRSPSVVEVRPVLRDRSGRLARVIAELI